MDFLLDKFVFFKQYEDSRVKDFPFTHSTLPVFFTIGLYLWIVLKAGPEFMKNRPAFKLDFLIQVYNLIQIALNLYMLFYAVSIYDHYSLFCMPIVDTYDYPHGLIIKMGYLYLVNKYIDLLDTVFCVLRKKFNQITFLHVFHHSGMAFFGWFVFKMWPGGHNCYVVLLNSIVHSIMYSYYLIASIYKNNRFWWKRYITLLQMGQFLLGGIIFTFNYFDTTCAFNKAYVLFGLTMDFVITCLFASFYYHAYIKRKSTTLKNY